MSPAPVAALAGAPAAAPALAWPGGAMSYGELRQRVASLAQRTAASSPPGGPVAVVTRSRLDTVLGVLAALRLGRAAMPLDPGRPDLERCLALAETGVMAPGADGQPAGLLVPTSGTTGDARVAVLPAAAMDAHVTASAKTLPSLGPQDRWLVCLPMTSIGALAALWRTLSAGACLALLERFDAQEARKLMAEGASHVSVVPAMLPALAECPAAPAQGLRCLLSGGGTLSTDVAAAALAAQWPLWNAWGMTETASHVAAGPVDEHWQEGIVGRPLAGVQLAADAGCGRIRIAGPMLMSGYASTDAAPGKGLQADGSLLCDDLGEMLQDGRLRILGRADEVIVTGGVNIHPEAVEQVLAHCEGVDEVALSGRPDARWGMLLVAIYAGRATPAELESWARAQLPSASRPRSFVHVERLPRNAMGKLLRNELRQIGLEA